MTLVGFGVNAGGDLGAGYKSPPQPPTTATLLLAAEPTQVVSAGQYTLALMPDGTVVVWGENSMGQLGDGNRHPSMFPVKVKGLTNVVELAASGAHCIVRCADGSVFTWGGNAWGTTGNGTDGKGSEGPATFTPWRVLIPPARQVAAGGGNCAALTDKGVYIWGENKHDLIDKTGVLKNAPVFIPVTGVKKIVLGGAGSLGTHLLMLMDDGTLKGRGDSSYGKLGDGSLTGVQDISTSFSHTLCLMDDGTIRAFGNATKGELGVPTPQSYSATPVTPPVTGVEMIAAGLRYSVAYAQGKLLVWGEDKYGQLGFPGANILTPTILPQFSGVQQISAGEWHTMVLQTGPGPRNTLRWEALKGGVLLGFTSRETLQWHIAWKRVGEAKYGPALIEPAVATGAELSGMPSNVACEVRVTNQHFGARTIVVTPL